MWNDTVSPAGCDTGYIARYSTQYRGALSRVTQTRLRALSRDRRRRPGDRPPVLAV
ncbi:hypothetical protein cu1504 [Corynebacterium urealyticum DSM 7109]|uniref:Uncharacterized protein n=1 Tax=Corynebacterium urealyticum (strain ATCC 43042 / DSM 7109) TaxID=504474 RepID=B1VI80_CORU7|nr:hypothetical protein cu1504 [Corynebacterium urealyticum DSM 7109]